MVSFYFLLADLNSSGSKIPLSYLSKSYSNTPLPSQMILEINLRGEITEKISQPNKILETLVLAGRKKIHLSHIKKSLESASNDSSVLAVLLNIGSFNSSLTTISEFRRTIQDFKKKSGKKVYAYLPRLNNSNYLLASVADRIYMPPVGDITLPGPNFQLTYFGSALKKLGVDFEVVRAGKFKSAFEPFIKDRPSTETYQMYGSIENNIRNFFVSEISNSRNLPRESIEKWFQKSMFLPKDGVKLKIIDELSYLSDLKIQLKTEYIAEYADIINYYYSPSRQSPTVEKDNYIAYIEAYGEIVMERGEGEERISPRGFISQLEWAKNDMDIKAVVLRIDSPGGSANASDLIWNEVRKLVDVKPVVVSMGSVAASGGYYIASPASKIVADPYSITGSIGVISAIPNGKNFEKKYGISFYSVSKSDRKALYNFGEKLSGEDKKVISNQTDYVYDQFVSKVASGRKLSKVKVFQLAEGRVYSGIEAKEHSLVDSLGGLKEAFKITKELAGLDPALYYPVKTYSDDSNELSNYLKILSKLSKTSLFWDGVYNNLYGKQLGFSKEISSFLNLWNFWGANRATLTYSPYLGAIQ